MTSTVRHNVLQNVVFWLSISGVFPENCDGFVALRCCRVEQTLLNSGEQLWCEIGHVDALKATKEQQKVVTFKCSHRARFT